jgi:NTE family protein
MPQELAKFLASTAVFGELTPEELTHLATLVREEKLPSGSLVLRQGAKSEAVYFLRSGQLAVRIQRGGWRETVAYLQPPDIFGELSFITGKACVADVEVLVDADIVLLPREAVPLVPGQRETLLRSLTRVIATRLQDTVSRGAKVREAPVVLLHNHDSWEAPTSFGWVLGRSLARQTDRKTLVVQIGTASKDSAAEVRDVEGKFSVCSLPAAKDAETQRSEVARHLTGWKSNFEDLILNPTGPRAREIAQSVQEFANWRGHLLGPQEETPEQAGENHFVVQGSEHPRLPFLSGSRQIIFDAAQSEAEHRAGRPVLKRFQRTVDSIARCIAGQQVGLALGGGAAWGWAHVGVLRVLLEGGLPIDMVSGCSMGSVIGAFYGAGFGATELEDVAEYWRTRTRRFIEWKFWRACLLNERVLRRVFHSYFGNKGVNQTEIPYWANAVDIKTGKEYTIQSGSLVECVRASIALPGLLPPSRRPPHLLVDAGIMDPVPVSLIRKMGCHFAIGVNAMAALESQPVSDRYPSNAMEVMTRSMFLMGHEIGQARAEKIANVLFTPALGNITMLQFSRSPEIIDCGRRAAEAQLPTVLERYAQLRASTASS